VSEQAAECLPSIIEYDKQDGLKVYHVECYTHTWQKNFLTRPEAVDAVALHLGKQRVTALGEMPQFDSIEEADAWAEMQRGAAKPNKRKGRNRGGFR
jgi:hypothetical protein